VVPFLGRRPLGLLRAVRDALRPVAALLFGFSILYCMTTSLAEVGEGLGTSG
jgi:hypothetical protein